MLEDYMKSLSGIEKLSRHEEARLWELYKHGGDMDARQTLIEQYQPLVFREAVKYPVQEALLLDLIQEGTVGLMEAADKFDIDKGVAFPLYAVHRIRGRIMDFLKEGQHEILLDEDEGAYVFAAEAVPDMAFEKADRKSLFHAIAEAIDRLPGQEQSVIRSVFLKERSAAETADDLDVSTAYVYRLQKRGIHRLRGMLSRLMHDRK